MNQDKTTSADREKLWELIKDIRFGMFTTRGADGAMHARPMTTQNSELDEDATLWLFMSRRSEAATELMADPMVCMTYADTDADAYVCLSGRAQVSEDRARKEALWSTMTKAWFPGGLDDPDLLLVRLNIQHAEYWDVKDSKIVQLWRMARAAVTGKPPSDMAEHAELDLR